MHDTSFSIMKESQRFYFLTGFMGTGKTYWAKRMSALLKLKTFDLDSFIEQKENVSIPNIFSKRGEADFRVLESRYLKELLKIPHNKVIISLGGGTLIDHNNLRLVKEKGILIWLKSNRYNFTIAEEKKRPLLADHTIEKLYTVRKQHYRFADHSINIDRLNEDQIENNLKNIIEK